VEDRESPRDRQQIRKQRERRRQVGSPRQIRDAPAADKPGRYIDAGQQLGPQPEIGRLVDPPVRQIGDLPSDENGQHGESDEPD